MTKDTMMRYKILKTNYMSNYVIKLMMYNVWTLIIKSSPTKDKEAAERVNLMPEKPENEKKTFFQTSMVK